jgi:site-specific recombinase XerD
MSANLVPFPSAESDSNWSKLKALVLDSVSAESSRRLYAMTLDAFYTWYFSQPRASFGKALVQEYRSGLERHGYAPSTIALHLSALRKLAAEAADNGLIDPQIAAAVCRIKGPQRRGRRIGNWLSASQAAALINAPEPDTMKGTRDQAILAVAIGCGLRRSEIASLTVEHLQMRDGRWIIADLVGKHGRIRTVPVPVWAKNRLDRWLERAKVTAGRIFRSMNKAEVFTGNRMTSQAVYEVIKTYGARVSLPIAPHDLRRTFAKLAFAGDARIEQIQYSLGHGSVTTTELYLGVKQDLVNAPGDHISLPL